MVIFPVWKQNGNVRYDGADDGSGKIQQFNSIQYRPQKKMYSGVVRRLLLCFV